MVPTSAKVTSCSYQNERFDRDSDTCRRKVSYSGKVNTHHSRPPEQTSELLKAPSILSWISCRSRVEEETHKTTRGLNFFDNRPENLRRILRFIATRSHSSVQLRTLRTVRGILDWETWTTRTSAKQARSSSTLECWTAQGASQKIKSRRAGSSTARMVSKADLTTKSRPHAFAVVLCRNSRGSRNSALGACPGTIQGPIGYHPTSFCRDIFHSGSTRGRRR